MKKFILLFVFLIAVSGFSENPSLVQVVNLPESNLTLINALLLVHEKQDLIIARQDDLIFLNQCLCVSVCFVWGAAVIHMAIVAKNQKSLM